MNDKLKELYEKVSGDDSLKESFTKGLGAISNDDERNKFIIDFAKEQGITLTMDDFPKADSVQQLSDADLENVVGGQYGEYAYSVCGDPALIACSTAFAMAGFGDC